MTKDTQIVSARRRRLREWIDARYDTLKAFVDETGINQGELSALLKDKSFGEVKAANLEAKAGMPAGYLVTPLLPLSVREEAPSYAADPSAAIERLRSDLQTMQQLVGMLTISLVQNVPDVVERVLEGLREPANGLPIDQNFLKQYVQRADTALAKRRQNAGPLRIESTRPSVAVRRP